MILRRTEDNMEEKNQNEAFRFTYSAAQQAEVKKIREKYAAPEQVEDKLELLRRLDAGVTRKGSVVALTVGILSTLVMGVGMCCCMVWGGALFIPGIVIGVVGIAGISLAYPLYTAVTKRERERIAPEILHLADQLMQ